MCTRGSNRALLCGPSALPLAAMKTRLAALFIVLVTGSSIASNTTSGDAFLSQLKKDRPEVRWIPASLVARDLDGDGKPDYAAVGYGKKTVLVAVQAASTSSPTEIQYVEFGIGQAQDAVCRTPVQLKAIPLSCELDGGDKLPGCSTSGSPAELSLDDESCDPIYLYWNHDVRHMTWWRN